MPRDSFSRMTSSRMTRFPRFGFMKRRTEPSGWWEGWPKARPKRKERIANAFADTVLLLTGASVGGMAMYMFDSHSGRRRRGMAKDRTRHLIRQFRTGALRRAEDFMHRAWGSVAEVRSRARDTIMHPDDSILEARVRAQVGHVLSHSSGLEVQAEDGYVIVRGPVLVGETEKLLHRLKKTRGVQRVELQVTEQGPDESQRNVLIRRLG